MKKMINIFLSGILCGVMMAAAITYTFAIPGNNNQWRVEVTRRGGGAWSIDRMAISVGDGLFNQFPSRDIPPLLHPSVRALRVFLTRTFERPVFPVRRLLTRSTQDAPKCERSLVRCDFTFSSFAYRPCPRRLQ